MLLELKEIFKLYKPENDQLQIPALKGIDFNLKKSDLVAIIGPSGAGKSTLIKLIGGMDTPTSGTIHVDGVGYINSLKGNKLADYRLKHIGFVHQFPEQNLVPNLTAFENIILPMKFSGKLGHQEQKRRTNELLDSVGMFNRKNNKLSQLSGGEAQRVSIAIALANNPSLVLADEPTGELDSENTFKIIDYFKKLNNELETSFIVVTHDERFAKLTENIYRIENGLIYELHKASYVKNKSEKNFADQYKEILYIDKHGNIKIPAKFIKRAKLEKHIQISFNEQNNIEILPVKD